MCDLEEARKIALTYFNQLQDEVCETDDGWIFFCDSDGVAMFGGGDPIIVSKEDGSSRQLFLILKESWEVLDSMRPVLSEMTAR